ncbi:hypothetical protein T10_490 [Trichinella papuae]|uniref:PiggyBac transposable element-derived protein 3 n=1 Tax=Trichinella papuae TaxID=268474 RepID=A0A0V1M264_9BILA|nr:hypothetical protein T10_490 [Trichinella papuae]
MPKQEVQHQRGPTGRMSHLPDIGLDGINHTFCKSSQGRCKVCKKHTKNMCSKCNVRLHAE